MQTCCVVVNPGGTTLCNITTEDGHVTGKVPHQEEEETRSCQRHNDFAADGGRDEFACCRDNVVHKCNNVFATTTLPHSARKSKHQYAIHGYFFMIAQPKARQKQPTKRQTRHLSTECFGGKGPVRGSIAARRSTASNRLTRSA